MEAIMFDQDLEQIRNRLIELAADCFTRNTIDAHLFESFVQDINHTHNDDDLRMIATTLEAQLA